MLKKLLESGNEWRKEEDLYYLLERRRYQHYFLTDKVLFLLVDGPELYL